MTMGANFRRSVDVLVSKFRDGAAIQNYLASEAETNIRDLVLSGQASPRFRLFVDGVEDAPLNTIKLDGTGTIIALFSAMSEAAAYALNYAITHSPRGATGEYAASWVLLVNGTPFGANVDPQTLFRSIPLGAEVVLTNFANYHRKIDVGGMRISVPPLITEQTRQAVLRRFPTLQVERKFITLPGGYVLKGRGRRSGIAFDKKRRKFYQRHDSYLSREADRQAGQPMTYPAVVMSEPV